MARKRMISPEFWTDSTMVALPFEARLLYIGMWTFADDYGYLADEPEKLALQVLPADDVDVAALVDLLVAAERIIRYEGADGVRYLHIRHFADHQKVDHPGLSLYATREDSRRLAIPLAVRRAVATKYGCPPGGESAAECYYCRAPGRVRWWPGRRNQPGPWVSFSGLELDHFEPEYHGGAATPDNLVLACRSCNRSQGTAEPLDFLANPREPSRGFARAPESRARAEVSLREEKLREENAAAAATRPRPREAAAAAAASVPESVKALHASLTEAPGYEPSPAFLEKVAAKYGYLDLEEEAIKILGWLRSQPKAKRRCSTAFVLNWLDRTAHGHASAQPRASPNGRARTGLRGPGGRQELTTAQLIVDSRQHDIACDANEELPPELRAEVEHLEAIGWRLSAGH